METKIFYCVFTHEGKIVDWDELTEQEVENYNSVWGINVFDTKEQAEDFMLNY